MGKVTVLVGKTGSGKTLLTSCLGQQWASGLVSSLFVNIYNYLRYQTCSMFICMASAGLICIQRNKGRAIVPEFACWCYKNIEQLYFHTVCKD